MFLRPACSTSDGKGNGAPPRVDGPQSRTSEHLQLALSGGCSSDTNRTDNVSDNRTDPRRFTADSRERVTGGLPLERSRGGLCLPWNQPFLITSFCLGPSFFFLSSPHVTPCSSSHIFHFFSPIHNCDTLSQNRVRVLTPRTLVALKLHPGLH
ncbi:unnamed protein product [Ixodes pacificus]